MRRRRALVMIAVYVLIIAHVVQWLVTGWTVGPFVASDAMETLENGVINGGFVILALLAASVLVAGRFACGWACHMGGLQDLCAWLLRKGGIRPRLFRARLLGAVPLVLGLYMFVWPSFRRDVLAPLLRRWWPDALAWIGPFHDLPGWTVRLTTEHLWERLPGAWVAIPFLLVCGGATVYFLGARGFCRYGCPYGGVLAPLEQLTPGRITADLARCDRCGRCTAVCESGVRVMEEIWAHGRVVSRHCMRMLDCVAVCPKNALRFGAGTPGVFRLPGRKDRPRAVYDLSWPEECLVAGAFAGAFFTLRGLYDLIPMLMAVGLAVSVAFGVWKTWRLLRDRDVRFAGMQLRRAGRMQPAGWAGLATAAIAGLLLMHSVAVRAMIWWGGVLERPVTVPAELVFADRRDAITPEMTASAREALAWYRRAAGWAQGGWALTDTPSAELRRAWLHLVCNEPAPAEARMRRAIARLGYTDTLSADLARILVVQGQPDKAVELLTGVVTEHPGYDQSRRTLCWILLNQNRGNEAVVICERAVATRPEPHVRAHLAAVYVSVGRLAEARTQLERAVTDAPRNASIRHDLACVRFMTGDMEGALGELRRAAQIDARGAGVYLRRGAAMLAEAGRLHEAHRWLREAEAADRRSDSP